MFNSSKIWLGVSGVLLVVLGVICLFKPFATLAAAAWLIGFMTLFAGISRLIFTVRTERFLPNSGSRMLSSILLILLGIFFLCNNYFVTLSLPLLFILWVLVESIMITIQSFDYKKAGVSFWWAITCLGILGIILGIAGLRNPDVSVGATSTIISLSIIFLGVAYLLALCGVNRLEERIKEIRRKAGIDEQ